MHEYEVKVVATDGCVMHNDTMFANTPKDAAEQAFLKHGDTTSPTPTGRVYVKGIGFDGHFDPAQLQ